MTRQRESGEWSPAIGGGPDGPSPVAFRRRPPVRPIAALLTLLALHTLLAVACGRPDAVDPDTAGPSGTNGVPDLEAARDRAVALETGGCGHADATRGSGLAIAGDLVLTAAHVVASGGPIEVTGPHGAAPAELVAYDPQRDLALVRPTVAIVDLPAPPVSGRLAVGDDGLIVGSATSGDVPVTVAEVLIIETDDVRSPTRSTRRGYLTEAATAPGDSGAGFYDGDGRLIGLLFAVSTIDGNRSWVTASSEIDAFLDDETSRGRFVCDPDRSRVARRP